MSPDGSARRPAVQGGSRADSSETAAAAPALAPTNWRLRPATAADRDALRAVYASTREEELALADWPAEQKERFVEQQFAAQDAYYRANYPGATFDVVELDGAVVGRLYVDRWPEEIRLMDIALLPAARGRGLGERLVRRLMDEAATAGKPLSIHVERFNRALSLYDRLGFRLVEDRGVYLLLAWRPR